MSVVLCARSALRGPRRRVGRQDRADRRITDIDRDIYKLGRDMGHEDPAGRPPRKRTASYFGGGSALDGSALDGSALDGSALSGRSPRKGQLLRPRGVTLTDAAPGSERSRSSASSPTTGSSAAAVRTMARLAVASARRKRA
jgi:hypothetical protein